MNCEFYGIDFTCDEISGSDFSGNQLNTEIKDQHLINSSKTILYIFKRNLKSSFIKQTKLIIFMVLEFSW